MTIKDAIWREFGILSGDILPFTARKGDRNNLYKIAAEFNLKTGVEVGVEWGRNALAICRLIPDVNLYCVDPYLPYYANGTRPSLDRCNHIMSCAMDKVVDYDVTFIRKKSVDAAKDFEDESLDFVYIDGSHNFDSVMLDLLYWVPKVKTGGIVAGHDYNEGYLNGVIPAVRAYTHAHYITEWYITSEKLRSFFWVKTPFEKKGYSTLI